jgi:adenosylmethionine-8-amino-7-oxononanoate aminotransferase
MAVQFWQLTGQPERRRFLSFDNAYHGDTAGAASLGGLGAFFDRFEAVHFRPQRVAGMEALAALPTAVCEQVAAIIVEPKVQGAAGIRLWPDGMLKALRDWCDQKNVLLIFDEVLTGFGRTGKMFACQHEQVLPDFLCLAKGLTGGYLPLAATLTTDKIYSAFLGGFEELKTFFYGHSYCGNALGCAAALASLEIFETENVLGKLEDKIRHLHGLLENLAKSPFVSEVRQCGFIAGIELQRGPGQPCDWRHQTGARVCMAARKHGLLTRPILDTIALIPPLCITESELTRAARALELAISEVLENDVISSTQN